MKKLAVPAGLVILTLLLAPAVLGYDEHMHMYPESNFGCWMVEAEQHGGKLKGMCSNDDSVHKITCYQTYDDNLQRNVWYCKKWPDGFEMTHPNLKACVATVCGCF